MAVTTTTALPTSGKTTTKQHEEELTIAHHELTLQSTPLPSPHYLLPDPTEKMKYEAFMERFESENALLAPQGLEDDLLVCLESIETRLTVGNLAWIHTQVKEGEFWACVLHDFPGTAAKLPRLLISKLASLGGVPSSIRGTFWQAFSQSTNLTSLYAEFQQSTSSYEHIIRRHTPDKALARLLAAYSLYDPLVGYSRNLADLARPLLTMMPEKEAFGALVRLMETYELRTMHMLNMEGLHLRLDQFAALFGQQYPRLASHLATHNVTPEKYASQWYLTLFADGDSSFPMDLVLHVYDHAFSLGAYETITRYALALMKKNEDALLRLDNAVSLISHLTSRMVPVTAEEAMAVPVTHEKLETMVRMQQCKLLEEKKRRDLMLKAAFEPPEKLYQTLQAALSDLHQEHVRMALGVNALCAMDHESERLKKRQTELESRAVRYEHRLIEPKNNAEGENSLKDDKTDELHELLRYKHLNFELAEKMEELEDKHDKALDDLRVKAMSQLITESKVNELQAALERARLDKEQLEEEQCEALEQREATEQQIRQAKHAAAEMQRTKLSLTKRVMALEKHVVAMEQEKQDYTTPHESFAEEVFKAHETLFGNKKPAAAAGTDEQEYQIKYYESEQQCRELEKMFAEVKRKLSYHRQLQNKRYSGMSVGSAVPLSPSLYEEGRMSMDSMVSYGSKRSSVYSRIWNSFGSTAATSPASSVICKSPVLASTCPIDLVEEPEAII